MNFVDPEGLYTCWTDPPPEHEGEACQTGPIRRQGKPPIKGPNPERASQGSGFSNERYKALKEVLGNAISGAVDRLFSEDCAGLFFAPDSAAIPEVRKWLADRLVRVNTDGLIRLYGGHAPDVKVAADTTDTFGVPSLRRRPFFSGVRNRGSELAGPFTGMTLADFQQLVIIHEFVHWMGIVGPDSGQYSNLTYTLPNGDKVTGSAEISGEIRKKCFD